MLFTPATKTDHFDAAANVGADAVILDLEDSVAPEAKDGARCVALNYLAAKCSSRTSVALRINSPATLAGWQDLGALLQSAADPAFIAPARLRVAVALVARQSRPPRCSFRRSGHCGALLLIYQ
jgi:(S)-citramalyl-CoA lyase